MIPSVALVFASLVMLARGNGLDCETIPFQNEPLGPLNFDCEPGHALVGFDTCFGRFDPFLKRSNGYYDRQWKWYCDPLSILRKEYCFETSYLQPSDAGDSPILYQCPPNFYLAGVKSYYDNNVNSDRFWRVRCCNLEDWCQRDCRLTDYYVNDFQEDFYYFTPPYEKYVLTGLFSEFSSGFMDRRWKFEECRFSLCDFDAIINSKIDD